jgi:tol-pal system protein YbgF
MKRLAILSAVVLVSQACFASKSDFEVLRTDVAAAHQRAAVTDSIQRVQISQLNSISRSIAAITDSLRAMNGRLESSRSMTQSEISGMKQDIARLQDISGQSEERLKEIRATLEDKAPVVGADSVSTGPGPARLLQLGKDQMIKRSYSSGRAAMNDLIAKYPESDLVPDAIFEIAQSYRAENNLNAADSAYADLALKYPDSPRIPSVLYKRGLILQTLGRQAQARQLFQEVRRRFPRSAEATLAQERLGGARQE